MSDKRTLLAPYDEIAFQDWYTKQALKTHTNPNPDDPLHHYDFRGAYQQGGGPSQDTAHWPSEFKDEDHPRKYLYLDGRLTDTSTMKPVEGMPQTTPEQVQEMQQSFEDLKRYLDEKGSK